MTLDLLVKGHILLGWKEPSKQIEIVYHVYKVDTLHIFGDIKSYLSSTTVI